jgi:DNA topoisomerase-1
MRTASLITAASDPAACAKQAGLSYRMDDTPGWKRVRTGKASFRYEDERGRQVKDLRKLARIEALRIPPAWQDVWIASSARGHLQATGVDAKGRKQYLYHEKWSAFREELKFSRLAAFADVLPKLRRDITRALAEDAPTKARACAAALALIDELALRVGSDAYEKENGTYGVTTLQNRHVMIDDETITLHFVGKSHQEHELSVEDARLAEVLAEEKALPGARLFQYVDEDGFRHPLTAEDVNVFLRKSIGGDFTAKDFRTWIGTAFAYELMRAAAARADGSERGWQNALRSVVKEVAGRLGNTVAVCRAHYIHEALQRSFADGSFAALLAQARRAKRVRGLSVRESEAVYVLRRLAKAR